MTVGIVLIRSSQCWSSLNIFFNLEGNWSHWDGDLLPTIQNHGRQVIRSPQRIEAVKPETFGWKTTLPVLYKLWSLLQDIFTGFALMLRVRCVRETVLDMSGLCVQIGMWTSHIGQEAVKLRLQALARLGFFMHLVLLNGLDCWML